MNRKGFTLVELLGVIVILGIIMLIAIPNIASLTQKNKKNTYIADSKKLVSLAQRALKKGEKDKPGDNNIEIITLESLSTSDVEKDSDGNTYDTEKSYVAVSRINSYLVYGVQLVTYDDDDNTYEGIPFTRVENLDGSNKYNYYNSGLSTSSNPAVVLSTDSSNIATALAAEPDEGD